MASALLPKRSKRGWLEIHERLELHELGSWEEKIQVTRDIIIK